MTNTEHFFEIASQVDKLIPLVKPKEEDRNLLFRLIDKEPTERYFFKHLAASGNPSWFPYLKEKGYFNSPPAPIKVEGGLTYPRWPALSYLAAIVSELPSEVVEVAEHFQIENAYEMSTLVGSFVNISADYAPQISQIIINWLDLGLYVNEELIALIRYWADNEQWVSAYAIIQVILTPLEEPAPQEQRQSPYFSPRAKFRQFDYFIEQFLKLILPELLEHHCIDILSVLEKKIIQALTIERSLDQEKKSSYWRSSIEPSSQNMGDRCKDLLLNAAIGATQALVDQQHIDVIPTINHYLEHPYSIYRRLAIHTIRENEQLWPRYLDDLYSDPKYWDDINYYHEYWLLTHQTFSALTPESRDVYLHRIMANLPKDREGFEKEAFIQERHWTYCRLWAIQNELSNTIAQPIFEKLQKEFGDPDPPEWFAFQSYSTGVRSGWVSPKSSVELVQLSPDKVLAELKKPYKPSLASFDEPTREGLATELGRAIKDDPKHFTAIAPSLVDEEILPLYVAHAIRGFGYAWKEKMRFDWEPIIELSQKVSQIKEELTPDGTPIDMIPNYWDETYGNARSAVAELLNIAVEDNENAIPHHYLDDVRDILLRLTDDINPSPEYEEKWGEGEFQRYLDLALNVTRSKALESLIHYCLHRAHIADRDESTKYLLPSGIRLESIVREKLTEKLDKSKDPSRAVHSQFGIFLPNLHYLDKEWLFSHLDEIFPRSPASVDYWEVAWDGYLFRSNFFGFLYSELKPYYNYAVEQLAFGSEGRAGSEHSRARLSGHLALLYKHGEESLDGVHSLVARFFEIAPDNLRGEFIKTMSPGSALSELGQDSTEWLRMKKLWFKRYAIIQKAQGYDQIDSYREELATYLLWVPLLPEPLEEFYKMVESSALVAGESYLVILFEYLATVVTDHPRFVVTIYEKVLLRGFPPYFIAADRGEVESILETALQSSDQQAKDSAIRIINFFGERGDERYRSLLKLASD